MDLTLPISFNALHVAAYTFFVIATTLTCYWFLGKKGSPDDTKWAIAWVFWGAMFLFCVAVVINYVFVMNQKDCSSVCPVDSCFKLKNTTSNPIDRYISRTNIPLNFTPINTTFDAD
jgi:RsiW-degrading membrane proteinase PrsW (M82 family)